MQSSTSTYGSRLLREIENEEESLEDLLTQLRTTSNPHPPKTGIAELDALYRAHGSGPLAITDHGTKLLYHIIPFMISSHDKGGMNVTVVVLDLTGRFSSSMLLNEANANGNKKLEKADLKHVHIFFPSKENLRITLEGLEKYMLYGEHASHGREWAGTVILGGSGHEGRGVEGLDMDGRIIISVGWRGWLGVKREEVVGFVEGGSIEEAWRERETRMEVVEGKHWVASCEEGNYAFK